jgi:hypothetical protein
MSKVENQGVPAKREQGAGVNRRSFLSRLGAAGAAITATPFVGRADPSEPDTKEAAYPNRYSNHVAGLSA